MTVWFNTFRPQCRARLKFPSNSRPLGTLKECRPWKNWQICYMSLAPGHFQSTIYDLRSDHNTGDCVPRHPRSPRVPRIPGLEIPAELLIDQGRKMIGKIILPCFKTFVTTQIIASLGSSVMPLTLSPSQSHINSKGTSKDYNITQDRVTRV